MLWTDLAGKVVPSGKVRRELVADFLAPGSQDDTGWILPELATDVTVNTTFSHLGYRRANGSLHLNVSLTIANPAVDKLLFTLPAEFVPDIQDGKLTVLLGLTIAARIRPNGQVTLNASSTLCIGAQSVPMSATQRTLPSWLTMTAGTASFAGLETTQGYVQGTTGAVNGNQANLQARFGIRTQDVTEIGISAEALHFDVATPVFTPALLLGGHGVVPHGGALAYQSHVTPFPMNFRTIQAGATGTDNAIEYQWRDGSEGTRRKNVSLIMRTRTRELFWMEDDQVMGYLAMGSQFNNTIVRPTVQVTTRENVAHWFRLSQLRVWTEHN